MHICLESYVLMNSFFVNKKVAGGKMATLTMVILFPVIVLAGSQKLFYEKQIYPHNSLLEEKLDELSLIVKGDPVFTQFPALAYSVSGQYRQLPDDELENIAEYAQMTGVKWLLIVDIPEEKEVMKYWSRSYKWITISDLDKNYPEFIKYCCGFSDIQSDTNWRLYSFKH